MKNALARRGHGDFSVSATPDAPPEHLLRYQEHPRDQRSGVVGSKVSVDDMPVRSEHRRGGAEAAAAQLCQGVCDVSVLPTVTNADTRPVRGDTALVPKDVIAPQSRKICPGPNRERHPAEGARVEVDSTEPTLPEFEQFELEDAAPA